MTSKNSRYASLPDIGDYSRWLQNAITDRIKSDISGNPVQYPLSETAGVYSIPGAFRQELVLG